MGIFKKDKCEVLGHFTDLKKLSSCVGCLRQLAEMVVERLDFYAKPKNSDKLKQTLCKPSLFPESLEQIYEVSESCGHT